MGWRPMSRWCLCRRSHWRYSESTSYSRLSVDVDTVENNVLLVITRSIYKAGGIRTSNIRAHTSLQT